MNERRKKENIMKKKLVKKIAVPVIKAIAVKVVLDQIDKKLNKDDETDKKSKAKKKHWKDNIFIDFNNSLW